MRASDRKHLNYLISGGVVLLALLPLYYLLDPEGGLFPACPFQKITGLYCTGCGSQRALHDFVHLNLAESFGHNLLFPPAILLLIWHGCHRVARLQGKRFWNSPLDARKAPLIILAAVGLFTILRNLPWEPFVLLAP